ncbi:MAG TPA: hypothetical protein ENJ08_08485 [Gammaproteobacteria bacterium]|nr:hypothetical protein [Gammaproteobacteria bacterium]
MINTPLKLISSLLISLLICASAFAQTSSSTSKYFLLNPAYSASSLELMSLENNNRILAGGKEIVLNRYQRTTITDTAPLQGKVISATGPFTAGSQADATDLPVPASFAGTRFAIAHQRGDHTYYLYSLHGAANVSISLGAGTTTSIALQPGIATAFAAGDLNGVVGHIRADAPILVSHRTLESSGVDADAYPVPPAATELWGVTAIFTNFAAMQDNTTVTVADSNGNSSSFVIALAGNFTTNNFSESVFQGNGMALHVTADKPISVTATADLDGRESTVFLDRAQLANRYGIPLDAEYISIVCPEPDTRITLNTIGRSAITQSCQSTGNLVAKAYFHTSQSPINKGSYLESNKPVYMTFEALATDDEQNITGSDRESYYLLSDNFSSSPLQLMSLDNNNQIVTGGTEITLNKYQTTSISAPSQGSIISATGAFTMGSEADATDLPVPVSFAGTQFAIPHQRGSHTYFLYGLHGTTRVSIRTGASAATLVTLQPGVVTPFVAGDLNGVVGRIQSNKPILVSHETLLDSGADADAYPVPPAGTELWGMTSIFTNFAAMQDNTTVTVNDSNGNSKSFTIALAGNFTTDNLSESVFQGNGMALHVTADKPIAVTSTADQDGLETTAFLAREYLANRFGIPIDAEYIAVVCPEPGTSITLSISGNKPDIQACTGTGNLVSRAYFNAAQAPIARGSFLESNKPVYVVLESLAGDDEQNLLGARNVPDNNILMIVADDLGMDILQSFDIPNMSAADRATLDRVPTPNIDRLLISQGVKFTNVMANPVCSPTRASIQTGRYGTRTGVLWATFEGNEMELPLAETIIPDLLDQRGYNHAAIGKWHLSNSDNGGNDGPRAAGYGYHSGSFQNLVPFTAVDENGDITAYPASYFLWEKMVNGIPETSTTYAPTDNVDDALDWLNRQDLNQPWFIWFAFNAPHAPFQVPPVSTNPGPHQAALTGAPGEQENAGNDTKENIYRAMVEYMDEEIGRLIDSIPASELAQTTIIFIGDNGTPAPVVTGNIDPLHAKFTLYQQGIHVPMVVAGAGVSNPGRTSNQLINSTDLFATILELSGIDIATNAPPAISDSISFLPILQNIPSQNMRQYAFSETLSPVNRTVDVSGVTIQDGRFKLIRFNLNGREELYDLQKDILETDNLLPLDTADVDFALQQNKYNELVLELGKITP